MRHPYLLISTESENRYKTGTISGAHYDCRSGGYESNGPGWKEKECKRGIVRGAIRISQFELQSNIITGNSAMMWFDPPV
jgi:hypothetical protein